MGSSGGDRGRARPVRRPARAAAARMPAAATFGIALGVVLLLGGGGVYAWKRLASGDWHAPEVVEDLVHLPKARGARVARVIHLERGGATLTGGVDDSLAFVSSVVGAAKNGKKQITVPKFRGGDKAWKAFVACVADQYAPFDVLVTDVAPAPGTPRVLVAVGGKPSLLGYSARTSGLAPYSSEVVTNPVVFVFADALANKPQAMCETAAMEIAHAYGLDHEHLCKDPMSYLTGCGKKKFQNVSARCGEQKPRDCGDGMPTQNSVARLMAVLGPHKGG